MRAAAYAVGLGCVFLLGAVPLSARAAEWSISPTYSWSVDHDSNRRLEVDPTGSEAAQVIVDLRFRRALEDTTISLEPKYTLRRFSAANLGNGDDRSVSAEVDRTWERSQFGLAASIFDQSTLTTELLETGILRADTHQRLAQASGSWNWSLSERRQLFAQLSYVDASYHGGVHNLLPGYRYSSGSVGELFVFAESGSLSVSAFGSALSSDAAGNSSHEIGLQAQLTYALSERSHLVSSVGRSERLLSGARSQGTDISVSLTHDLALGTLALSYSRNLVPYGVGFLVQRQQLALSGTRHLTSFLDTTLSLVRVRNDELTVLLNIDRRSYDSLAAGLNWQPLETWSLGLQLAAIRTQASGFFGASENVNEWRSALTLTWTPRPHTRSW